MATTKFYLDKRAPKQDGTYPLKIAITKKGRTALYSIGLSLREDQWDARAAKIVNHPQKQFVNGFIARRRADVEAFILRLVESGAIAGLTAKDIKDKVIASQSPEDNPGKLTFEERFLAFIDSKQGSTKELYEFTLGKLRRFCPKLSTIAWEEINTDWLSRFDAFLAKTAPSKNYRNIHLRNIRAVFNSGIDAEDTTCYPFRRFKIRPVPTRKRSLTVEALCQLFDYPVEEYAVIYRDLFKLIFMLIGINSVDLHRLTEVTPDGRIEYKRAKTGRLYSIKVEPEAMEIIEKYRGEKGLLCISDRWSDHRNFRHQINNALQRIGKVERVGRGGKKVIEAAFPGISTYWARHTWATIAADLDIPDATISLALGHAGENATTEIYINRNLKKVDAANRRVIDWVLYGKR